MRFIEPLPALQGFSSDPVMFLGARLRAAPCEYPTTAALVPAYSARPGNPALLATPDPMEMMRSPSGMTFAAVRMSATTPKGSRQRVRDRDDIHRRNGHESPAQGPQRDAQSQGDRSRARIHSAGIHTTTATSYLVACPIFCRRDANLVNERSLQSVWISESALPGSCRGRHF
jgi:hypothetical protein